MLDREESPSASVHESNGGDSDNAGGCGGHIDNEEAALADQLRGTGVGPSSSSRENGT